MLGVSIGLVRGAGKIMRLLYLAFTFALIIGAPKNAWPQSALSDNAFRAAYCVGVLDESLKTFKPVDECPGWANFKLFASEQDCKDQLGGAFEQMRRDREQKRKRYAFYLATQRPSLAHMMASIVAINEKGKADYQERADTLLHERLPQCSKSCDGAAKEKRSEFSIVCLAEHDQVQANIWKCLAAPDQLPF